MGKRCYGCMKLKNQSPNCEHCGYDENKQNDPHQLPVGTLLRSQYRVGKVLGQGGFGITYLGFDENLETPVAIKEYYPTGMVSRDTALTRAVTVTNNGDVYQKSLDRFLREARSLAQLDRVPGIVKIKNFFTENGTAYIVMEYLEGMDLRAYALKRGAPLSPRETLNILRPVMAALDGAHRAGVVHRDISPDNIMLLKNGEIRVLDFGTARQLETEAHSTEMILKHGFAPTEQYLTRGEIGPWTDVYAICATAYYCMTGRVPTAATDRMMGDEGVDFGAIPGLTEGERNALTRGMAVRIPDRIPSMGALLAALDGPAPFAAPQAPVMGPQTPAMTPPAPKKKRKPWIAVAAIAAVIAVAAGALLVTGILGNGNLGEEDLAAPQTMATGLSHAVGVRYDGTVLAVGRNADGQCDVGGWRNIVEVAAGYYHTVGLRSDGTVVAVGDNEDGQCDVSGWTDIVAVAAGDYHTVGLRSDGTVVAVGDNEDGQCDVSKWRNVVAIAASDNHTVGLCRNGTVVETDRDLVYSKNGVRKLRDIVAIADGSHCTVGLRSDGTVVVAGDNWYGEGDVGAWTDIVTIAAGSRHTVGLRSDGTVVAVGENKYGQCDVDGWTDIVAVVAGWDCTVGLRSDGTIVVAGSDSWDQNGVTTWTDIRIPKR